MAQSSSVELPVDRRREIFLAVVEAQDRGLTVDASRAETAARFEITASQVEAIEREGLKKDWPPLS
jgi:hypothetical protein